MAPNVLMLGIGNLPWADESFGVRCVEKLARGWRFEANVQILDGGTRGLYLLPFLEETEILVVFDALDCGLPPGTLRIIEGDAVPAALGARGPRLDQPGFGEVIEAARRMGSCPGRLLLVAYQPGARADDGIDAAIALALARLRDWDVVPRQVRNDGGLLAGWPIRPAAPDASRVKVRDASRTVGGRFLPWGA